MMNQRFAQIWTNTDELCAVHRKQGMDILFIVATDNIALYGKNKLQFKLTISEFTSHNSHSIDIAHKTSSNVQCVSI